MGKTRKEYDEDGVVMAVSKILDAFTDVIYGNIVDYSRGGNRKYFRWMILLAVPAAAIVALMFTVPKNAADGMQTAYALVTNILLSAVIYTMIATPFSAVMVVRTRSNSERSSMGVFRAVGSYAAGMIIAIATIPVTNLLGGTQDAWIKYGTGLGLFVLLLFLICWNNGHKAPFTREAESGAAELGGLGLIATIVGFVLSKPIINKVGGGIGSLLLSLFLMLGSYDASLAAASASMRWSIYGFSNYFPVTINLLMFFIFRSFDLEAKLPALREEVASRRT